MLPGGIEEPLPGGGPELPLLVGRMVETESRLSIETDFLKGEGQLEAGCASSTALAFGVVAGGGEGEDLLCLRFNFQEPADGVPFGEM